MTTLGKVAVAFRDDNVALTSKILTEGLSFWTNDQHFLGVRVTARESMPNSGGTLVLSVGNGKSEARPVLF